MLDVIKLELERGDRRLLTGLSFSLQAGELLHIAGRNGRGKTTLLRALCGLTAPAAGEIRWQGAPITDQREEYVAALAYVGHSNGLQGELTPPENLRTWARLHYGDADEMEAAVAQALERLDLYRFAALPSKFLSQGQKRRLALGRLALGQKRLWVLDEPFTALDAESVQRVNALLDAHLADGGLVALASHQAWGPQHTVKPLNLDSCAAA